MIRTDDGRLKLSASRLKTWLSCPLKWKAVYVDERPFVPTPAMAWGTAAHAGLESHARSVWLGEPRPDVLAVFTDFFDRSGVEIGAKERERMIEQARLLLYRYLDRYGDEGVIAAELLLTASVIDPLSGENLGELTGIVDLISKDGRLIDLKTSARSPSDLQAVIGNAVQLDCYRYLVAANQPGMEIRAAEIRSLIRTKEPKVEVTELPLRPFDALIDLIRRYKQAVEGQEVYPRPGLLCSDRCPAIEACRAHHGLEVCA